MEKFEPEFTEADDLSVSAKESLLADFYKPNKANKRSPLEWINSTSLINSEAAYLQPQPGSAEALILDEARGTIKARVAKINSELFSK